MPLISLCVATYVSLVPKKRGDMVYFDCHHQLRKYFYRCHNAISPNYLFIEKKEEKMCTEINFHFGVFSETSDSLFASFVIVILNNQNFIFFLWTANRTFISSMSVKT